MKKGLFMILFIIGLSIFLYPIVSNLFATTAHQSIIKDYNETIEKTDKARLNQEKEKVDQHNKELASSNMDYVDPFSEDNLKEESGAVSYYDALNLGPIIASVEIPIINVNLPIYHGSSEGVLSKGAGHMENSSLPSGEPGTHSVITAHRGIPTSKMFRDLNDIKIGDQFYIHVLDEILAYEVDTINTVLPSETDWLKMEENVNQMTLLTCDPYMINTHRLLVTGHRIPYIADESENEPDRRLMYIAMAALLILLLMALVILYFKKYKGKRQ